MRRLTITVGGTCLVILVFAGVSVVTDSQSFFGITERTLESFKDNSNKRVMPVHQNISPQMISAGTDNAGHKKTAIEFKWNQPIIVQYGSTIYEIANNTYGINAVLGMDLIKEFNPQIKDLNWVSAGHKLVLPALTQETLVRQHGTVRTVLS